MRAAAIAAPPEPVSVVGRLSASAWLRRAMDPPAPLLGEMITDTSRVIVGGPTGIGKSHLGFAMAAGMASGSGFLHWRSTRPARVLYVDGEMPRDLIQARLRDLATRTDWAAAAPNLFVLCSEDFDDLAALEPKLGVPGPLNTEQGTTFLLNLIDHLGGVDAVFFDNRMSLTVGDMKEELTWNETLPLVKAITQRRIAQVWFDHMGHGTDRIYGSKVKEWQMDVVAALSAVETPGADISFRMEFTKARRRQRSNWADFEPVTITLADDQWSGTRSAAESPGRKLAANAAPVLEAIHSLLAEGHGRLRQPFPDGPTVSGIALPTLRQRLIRNAWFEERHIKALPDALPEQGVLTDAGYRAEGKALEALEKARIIGKARPEGRKGDVLIWLL